MPFLKQSKRYIVYAEEYALSALSPNIVSFHLLWETEECYSCSFDVEKMIPQVSWGPEWQCAHQV